MTGPKIVRQKPKPEEIEEAMKSFSGIDYLNTPLQVSRVVFREDGAAVVVEDVPTEFECVYSEEKKS